MIWAAPCENVSFSICRQRRHRSACASAQSYQDLCWLQTKLLDTIECFNGEQNTRIWRSAYAGWCESAHFAYARRHLFIWRGPVNDLKYFWNDKKIINVISLERNSIYLIQQESMISWIKRNSGTDTIRSTSSSQHQRQKQTNTINLYHSLGIFSRRQIDDIFLIFPRKQDLTFHANCLLRRQFAWNVISCFLRKIRKIFQNVVCWKFYPEC